MCEKKPLYIEPEQMETPENVSQRKSRSYSTTECVFAWTCMFAGYLFCKSFPAWNNPLGSYLVILLIVVAATVALRTKGIKPRLLPVAAMITAAVIASALVLSANGWIRFAAFCYAVMICCYYIYAAAGNSLQAGFTDWILADVLQALFLFPFCSLADPFRAMFSGRAKKTGKLLARILLGIGLAVIPTLVVLALLSYDEQFSDMLINLLDLDRFDGFSHIFSLLFGIPVGMYLFSLYISSVDRKGNEIVTRDRCSWIAGQVKFVPAVTGVAAVLPLLFIYAVFFVSQWTYFVSGFIGVLPESYSYAEYARAGFAQLCIVSVINFLMIIAVLLFTRCKSRGESILLKSLVILFSLATLILMATAFAKLYMYIECYGLTPKRLYAAWGMAVLAVIFLLIAAKQFFPKLNAAAAAIVVFTGMFALVSLPNVDGYIATYNVSRYLEGSLETVDMEAMEDLGLAAVPQMVRLAEALEEVGGEESVTALRRETKQFLRQIHSEYFKGESPSLFTYSVPYIRAKNTLQAYGIGP